MSMGAYGPRGPRGRGRRLIRPLRFTGLAALVIGLAGASIPGTPGAMAASVLVGVLIATPVARVGFLAARWWQIGDRRYAWSAIGLLLVIAAGAAASALT